MLLAPSSIPVLTVPDGADYGYGSIGTNFGSTNLDNIPSSGGIAGYTSQISVGSIPAPTPIPWIPNVTLVPASSTPAPASSGVNTSQSGTVDPTLAYLSQLYANQFNTPSAASTSGTPVVVVPQGQAAATGSSPSASPLIALGLVGVVAFLGYKWYKGRA